MSKIILTTTEKNKYKTIKNCVDNNGNKKQAAMHRGVLYVQYIVISTTVKPVVDVIFLTISGP